MDRDSVNPEPQPGDHDKPVLPYGQAQPAHVGGNVFMGCVMALVSFAPIFLAATSSIRIHGPAPDTGPLFVFLVAVLCLALLYLSARRLERKGRRGVMVGAAAMTGACLLAAGICFGALF
jgi:uncharacterized BrkB/YihY/UPF0761 family membrane protein